MPNRDLIRRKLTYEDSKLVYERQKKVYEQGVIPEAEFQQYRLTYMNAWKNRKLLNQICS